MRKIIYILFLIYNSIFIINHSYAQTFNAQVSKTKVAVGEHFQLDFSIDGSGGQISLPNFNKDFDVVGGPQQSSSSSNINGRVSQSFSISYLIAAKKEGKFVIGSASCNSNGNIIQSKPITIEVLKGSTQANNKNITGNNSQVNNANNDEIFVRTFLNKSKCFVGEQLVLTQKVYARVGLRGFQKVEPPQYNGFWSEMENTGNAQPKITQENVNGMVYNVIEYYKVFLFPQRAGNITVEPIELECVITKPSARQPRNIIEQLMGIGGYEDAVVKVKSKTVKVEVLDLPTENKPLEFSGAVGDYSYKAEISKQQVKANDAVNLKITLSGKGNIKLVEPLKLNLPESFEVYDPKVTEKINTNGGVSGSKTFDYLIIPREQGEFVLDKLNFSYFDTDKKQYVTLPSPDIKLTVLQGDQSSAQIITPKKDIKDVENDIRYIKTGDLELKEKDNEFFSSWLHYALLLIPCLLFAGGLFAYKKHIKENSNLTLVKERKAAKMAKKQLVLAEKHMSANNKDLFFNETLNALNKYISDKFNLPVADLSKDKISEMLINRQVSSNTTKQTIDLLNTCEYAKYAPSAVTGDLKQVYQNSIELISQIEEQIKSS